MKKVVMVEGRKDIVDMCSGFPDWLQIIPPETDLFEETCDFIKDLYLDNELAVVVLGDGPEGDPDFLVDICDFIYNSHMEVKVILSTWNYFLAQELRLSCPEIFYFPFNSDYLKFLEEFIKESKEQEIDAEEAARTKYLDSLNYDDDFAHSDLDKLLREIWPRPAKATSFSTEGEAPMKFRMNKDGGMDQEILKSSDGPISFVFSKEEAVGLKKFLNDNF